MNALPIFIRQPSVRMDLENCPLCLSKISLKMGTIKNTKTIFVDKQDKRRQQMMYSPDYDKALYYILWGHWDDLLLLMVRTRDDLLSKRIHHFLNAFHYSPDEQDIMKKHDDLLYYVEHAMNTIPNETLNI